MSAPDDRKRSQPPLPKFSRRHSPHRRVIGRFFLPILRSPRFTHAHAHTHADKLKPADLVGVNKDSYLILDMLPAEYDSRVKAMEVDEKPTDDYTDIGGLEKQIREMREAIVSCR